MEQLKADVSAAVATVPGWYHTLDLPGGVTTPGWFDLRSMVGRIPWPDLGGLRCLDIATWDGFFAFEMERRGASEVLATDIEGHEEWDHLPGSEAVSTTIHTDVFGEKGRGFRVAAECLASRAKHQFINVYDLSPESVGTFDVVFCGALLLHLRDPFRALAAIRSVCTGTFISVEEVDVSFRGKLERRPSLLVRGYNGQWAVPTLAGHRRMLEVAGFAVDTVVGPFTEPFGTAHPQLALVERRSRSLRGALRTKLIGGVGVPKAAAVCHVV